MTVGAGNLVHPFVDILRFKNNTYFLKHLEASLFPVTFVLQMDLESMLYLKSEHGFRAALKLFYCGRIEIV